MKGYDTNFMRPCVFTPAIGVYDSTEIKGVFHQWVVIPHSYFPGGPLYAIVEGEDGK